MSSQIKVHLKSGSREIELEGPRKDVEELLAKWWVPQAENAAEEGNQPDAKRTTKARSAVTRNRASKAASEGKDGNQSFDPQPIVNAMREHKSYEHWEKKVLHARSAINKVKLVCWFDKAHRTSGEIRAILGGLGVKMGLPQVSNALKDNLSEFLQDGARTPGAVVRYKLTGKADKDFQTFLSESA